MTLQKIKNLNEDIDFIENNDKVWAEIEKLSIAQLIELTHHFQNDEIIKSITEIISAKRIQLLKNKISKWSPYEKTQIFELLLLDKDSTWDILRGLA